MKLIWKKTSGYKRCRPLISPNPNLPFEVQTTQEPDPDIKGEEAAAEEEEEEERFNRRKAEKLEDSSKTLAPDSQDPNSSDQKLAETFQSQGDQLAENGKYREALGKWEAALTLMPEKAVLHEQKAQVLLEIGDAWSAIKAATRATELEPFWAEAWITLGRAQLNFGEPDSSLESFNKALSIKPDSKEVQADRETALHLIKRRKQLHSSGSTSVTENRFKVGEKD
eukprot:TRINITY_DN4792_c1_g2_i1.p1 TRINITY_DN4792_c1_g2~~TRINITY_DN4792_c1_g2_i1.p1  ORF type:complete len:225 (+),score=56.27 TRINITY_DN4792_c1_g2_i1:98-772(+)